MKFSHELAELIIKDGMYKMIDFEWTMCLCNFKMKKLTETKLVHFKSFIKDTKNSIEYGICLSDSVNMTVKHTGTIVHMYLQNTEHKFKLVLYPTEFALSSTPHVTPGSIISINSLILSQHLDLTRVK